jgi:NAD(P)-dependent dehydrogenase (short-subunit alcohol dehydrogenase family)
MVTLRSADPPKTPVVVVTGASRGIGRAIAVQLATQGCSVVIGYATHRDGADETAIECGTRALSKGQVFVPMRVDVASRDDRRALVDETLRRFGRIDALVNNAGKPPAVRADLAEASEESFEDVLRVNLQGPYFLTQAVAQHWLSPDRPQPRLPCGYAVVFITSISTDAASVNRGEYCVSKAGLAMAAQLWATRLAADSIQVFDVRPGLIATDMTAAARDAYERLLADGTVPQRRWGSPADVALAVGSLLAGHFPYSTGAVLAVDGGLRMRRL